MKYTFTLLLLCSLALGQEPSGIVNEAKTKREKEHHAALVEKAKRLLEKKASLEAELASVNDKLEKVDKGIDVKADFDGCGTLTSTGASWAGGTLVWGCASGCPVTTAGTLGGNQ